MRCAQPMHPHFKPAERSVQQHIHRGDTLYVVPQNLYEFWVVATRPTSQNGLGFDKRQACLEIAAIRRLFILLLDERGIFTEWERLILDHDIEGKRTHDARLVAAAIRHRLDAILTFNVDDFRTFGAVDILSPTTSLA
ncbi:MAG: PIN domain nuclease [Planctomycetes bacterium]|nr:PIN domain nuclease [Planctomycetota bacterium]